MRKMFMRIFMDSGRGISIPPLHPLISLKVAFFAQSGDDGDITPADGVHLCCLLKQ